MRGGEQHREDVVAVAGLAAAVGDQREQLAVDQRAVPLEAPEAPARVRWMRDRRGRPKSR